MLALHKKYGKIAKVGGLIGHPDLLFIYDGDEIRKVFQREEIQPHRYRITQQYVLKLPPPIPLLCVCGCCLLSPYRLNFNAIFVYNVIHRCLFSFTSQSLHALPSPLQDNVTQGLFRRNGRSHRGVSSSSGRNPEKSDAHHYNNN